MDNSPYGITIILSLIKLFWGASNPTLVFLTVTNRKFTMNYKNNDNNDNSVVCTCKKPVLYSYSVDAGSDDGDEMLCLAVFHAC